MTLGKPTTPTDSIGSQIAAFLRPRWLRLTLATTFAGLVAVIVGGVLHWLAADAAATSALGTWRWIAFTWLVLAAPWWAIAILRTLRPARSYVMAASAAVALALCLGLPSATWWTYAVNHSAGKGAAFDSSAVFAFFSSAFSQYREPLTEEGEMKIGASVRRKSRSAVLDRVRQVRAVLDAPVPGETPPPGKDWQRTRYNLAMASKVPGEPGKLTYEVIAEETYPVDAFPYWGNAKLGVTLWTFTVRQDGEGRWWVADFIHPDVCAAYRYGHGCQVTDPRLLPSGQSPSPTPTPSGEGFNNWEFLPCQPRDPLRQFHECATSSPSVTG
ncbi:hypothetical protein HDA40_004167 [Hamadaea flava]|uniref:Uncharacterized protein n=1 Tax=Hamadaea flava TaxID=1742688 RepID=A0ABV8LHG0_9ACTN|nr:hypothetical protein [Hamadaea flava]MCP2325660.1 hypothetical protein [Hamadaea flava]